VNSTACIDRFRWYQGRRLPDGPNPAQPVTTIQGMRGERFLPRSLYRTSAGFARAPLQLLAKDPTRIASDLCRPAMEATAHDMANCGYPGPPA